jgi:hypothetical protein
MKKKIKIINLLMPLIVLFAILFPAVHSYEHILDSNNSKEKTELSVSEKPQFKSQLHSFHKCSICDFKFSAVGTFEFDVFTFFKSITVVKHVLSYNKQYFLVFKGSLFSLRAPPISL